MRWLLDAGAPIVSGEESFDANMIIILLALVCALICALAINSFLRCTLRLRRASEPTATSRTGLKRRALKGIPAAAYGPELDTPATECAICLGEFADGEKVRVLPNCNHGFHVGCIDTWLASRSSCPTCRRSLLER